MIKLEAAILSANTGADAIKRAPIVSYDTGIRCLRIGDISNNHPFSEWGFCEVSSNDYIRFALKAGQILVARTGASIGVSRYINQDLPSVYNNGLICLNVDTEHFYPEYIYYLTQSRE